MTQLPSPPTFRKSGKNYRRWTKAHKRQIVEETFVPGASVSVVARRHDVNANQVFKWRLQYHRGELGEGGRVPAGFVPVAVMEQSSTAATLPSEPPGHSSVPNVRRETSGRPEPGSIVKRIPRMDILQLELRNGIKLKLHAGIDPASLRQML